MTTEQRKVEKRKSHFETRLNTNVLCCDNLLGDNFAIGKMPHDNTTTRDSLKFDDDTIVKYGVKEFTEKSVLEVNDNDLTFFKMCIYFMRDKLKADNKMYEETLIGLSYCTTPEPEKSVYENMINMNRDTIDKCTNWLNRLENV